MNKFAQMWDYTNTLHDHRNNAAKKLEAMQQMINLLDAKTRDHFRAALTQVLREERNFAVRHEAIKQLGIYFTWAELEWTWWLHRRRKRDITILDVYENYAKLNQGKGLNARLLTRVINELAA